MMPYTEKNLYSLIAYRSKSLLLNRLFLFVRTLSVFIE